MFLRGDKTHHHHHHHRRQSPIDLCTSPSAAVLWTSERCQSCSRTPAVPIPERSHCIPQPLPTEGFPLGALRDALVIPDPEGWGTHGGLTQGHPSLPLNSRDHSCPLALTIPLSNLAVAARKLKDGKEKKFNPAPLEQAAEERGRLWLPAASRPARALPRSRPVAVEPRTAPHSPASPHPGGMAGCGEGKMLGHSEPEGISPGEGKGKAGPRGPVSLPALPIQTLPRHWKTLIPPLTPARRAVQDRAC